MDRRIIGLIVGWAVAAGCVPEQETDLLVVHEPETGSEGGRVQTDAARDDTGAGVADTGIDAGGRSADTGEHSPDIVDASSDTASADTTGAGDVDAAASCPSNSHERDGQCYCDDGYVVNEDQTACVRECTRDADCEGSRVCAEYECVAESCGSTTCGPGLECGAEGDCVVDPSTAPSGSPPDCSDVPDWRCSGSNCGELIQFSPRKNSARWDYPINGEMAGDQYRSWARRDLVNLIDYATAKTACQSENWSLGNGEPLGLGDMSEQDGAIPGTSVGNPGHPQGTHTDGFDIDLAYYQAGSVDNRLRPVCPHRVNRQTEYHCVAAPDQLDVWRTALFLAHLHVTPQLRVIGVDGEIGPLVSSALQTLCNDGWVETSACTNPKLAYEVEDRGRGWFRFHHHHAHVSLTTRRNAGFGNLVGPPVPPSEACLSADCRRLPPADRDPRRSLY